MLEFLKPLPLIFCNIYYHFAEFSILSFDGVAIDDATVAQDMLTKRKATRIVFQCLKISSSISIFDRHIFNNFVATVIRETNILVIFNVFMKYSALISWQNMMFNDEIYNNGGHPYFDFGETAEFKIVPFIATHMRKKIYFHGAMKKKNSADQNSPICMKTTDIKSSQNGYHKIMVI